MPQRELYIVPDYCDSMNDSLPGSSVHRILQARTLERIAHFLLHSEEKQDSFKKITNYSAKGTLLELNP